MKYANPFPMKHSCRGKLIGMSKEFYQTLTLQLSSEMFRSNSFDHGTPSGPTQFGLNNAHAIDSMLKHGGFSRHRLQGFL